MDFDFDPESARLAPPESEFNAQFDRRQFLKTAAAGTAFAAAATLPLPALARQRLTFDHHRMPLGAKVNAYIQQQRRKGRIRPDEMTSWSVYDFKSGRKLVSINEDVPRQAASMIKPFVVAAYFYELQKSGTRLHYNSKTRHMMELSIRNSNNWATNQLMKQVAHSAGTRSPRTVEHVLKKNAPAIFQNTHIVEFIPANGRTYKNKASAHDYSRFLYALWNDILPESKEIRKLMALPNRDRIKGGSHGVPLRSVVYDKTGTTAHLCGNMGIVEAKSRSGKKYSYTFVGIIEKRPRTQHYSRWARNRSAVIRSVSSLVYRDLKSRYHLV